MPNSKIDLTHLSTELDQAHRLEAREHTAQVTAEDRQEREDRFRSADLPLLFCSPTMELGVDIAQLNVVNLRNVPPTSANYAQRSGRAGRGGQPALVYTYCAGRSPHDQYYFRQPEDMVAGSVAAPRIDLRNSDLVRSHLHALWMEVANSRRRVVDIGMNDLAQLIESDSQYRSEHERDAAIGAVAALAMLEQRAGWRDLAAEEPDAFMPVAPAEYWMPLPGHAA